MKAVLFEGSQPLVLGDVPNPRLRDIQAPKKFKTGEYVTFRKEELVLLKVEAASICGTDLHILEGTHDSAPPVVLGHEYVGRVMKTGSEVKDLKAGDLVGVDPNIKCGLCDFCRRGLPNHCRDMTTLGIFIDGGFAQYNMAPAKQLYKLPVDLPLSRAVFFEPASCVAHAFENVEPKAGDTVLIYGGGTMGCLFTLFSQFAGASHVVVVEPSEYRRDILSRLGVKSVKPGEEPRGLEADVCIDACGIPSVVPRMFEFTKHGGRISLFGEQNIQAEVTVNPTLFNQKELQMFGSYATGYNFERTIQLLSQVPVEKLVTHVFDLFDFERAFQLTRKGEAIEVVFNVGGDMW